MDHDLYRYSALPTRPRLGEWREGKPVAVWVVLYLEHWELQRPPGTLAARGVEGPWGTQFPDTRTFSYREYGNRVGIFRVLDALADAQVPVTVAANASACVRYPALVTEMVRRGYELAGHGDYASRVVASHMDGEQEERVVSRSLEIVREASGQDVRGWMSQDGSESMRTTEVVRRHGVSWIGDWPNDEQPYPLENGVLSLPLQPELDDVSSMWERSSTRAQYVQAVSDGMERIGRDARQRARSVAVGIHPWLSGQPHRISGLREVLAAVTQDRGVWLATGSQIADTYAALTADGPGLAPPSPDVAEPGPGR